MAIIIGQLWLRFVIFLIFRNVKCAGYVRSDDLSQLLGGERNQKKKKSQVPSAKKCDRRSLFASSRFFMHLQRVYSF